MFEKLFSYGTLQLEKVQLENFGRTLKGISDSLMGYEIRECDIKNSEVIAVSEQTKHPIACFIGNLTDQIAGTVYELSASELQEADKYETDDYKRIKCILKSGVHAWVYVQSGLNIDISYFESGSIRLEPFDEKHISALTNAAQDPRIWQVYRSNFENPEIFMDFAIQPAKKAILNKTRYMFVIYYENEIIGSTSYYDIDLKHLSMAIGYTWMQPKFWGKGINPIIKQLMLRYAFEELKFKRISFFIDSENLRSRSAIEKLNIPLEGILKKHQIRPDGSRRDTAIYAITDEVWFSSL